MSKRFELETIFRAIDNFTAPVAKMNKRAETFIESTEKGFAKVDKLNERIGGGLKRIGAVGAGVAFATGAIIKDIVDVGATFDKTLVGAAAKFDPEITRGTERFRKLSDAAQKIGANTEFNAQQGAEALKMLASAGLNADQAIAALPGAVDLATVSEVDLGVASEMATKSLGAFGLQVDDATQLGKNLDRVNNVMAKTAGKTKASMVGLFESIKVGAPIAVTTGQSMETFMAMAGALAGAGIEGSVAGTTLKDAMLGLSSPTEKAARQLKKLGVATTDNGNLRNMVDIFADIERATKGMGTADRTAVLERIFGKIPLAGVSALLDQGAAKISGLRVELEKTDPYVARLAKTMRDTVAGDIDGFTSAIDGVKTAIFDMNTGPIREVVQGMTAWVKANQSMIVQKVGDAVKWVGDNLPAIVTWMERIAYGVGAFYAWSAAITTVKMGIETYQGVAAAAKGATWLFKKSLSGAGLAAEATASSLASMRGALNATALAKSINGVTGTLGKAGLLGAALGVGVAIGSWLNETFGLDEKIAGWISDLTGVSEKLEKAGRTAEQGLKAGTEQVFADGSRRRGDGTWIHKAPERITREAEAFGKVHEKMLGRAGGLVGEGLYAVPSTQSEPQVFSPFARALRTESEHVERNTTEVVIRDETGRAEMKDKPKSRGAASIKLQPSGAF